MRKQPTGLSKEVSWRRRRGHEVHRVGGGPSLSAEHLPSSSAGFRGDLQARGKRPRGEERGPAAGAGKRQVRRSGPGEAGLGGGPKLSSLPCSYSGSAGRVALSREDKEAAKLGLSVFTVTLARLCTGTSGGGERRGWEGVELWYPGRDSLERPARLLVQHHRVDSSSQGTSPAAAKRKPHAEDKAEHG